MHPRRRVLLPRKLTAPGLAPSRKQRWAQTEPTAASARRNYIRIFRLVTQEPQAELVTILDLPAKNSFRPDGPPGGATRHDVASLSSHLQTDHEQLLSSVGSGGLKNCCAESRRPAYADHAHAYRHRTPDSAPEPSADRRRTEPTTSFGRRLAAQ